jgi:signal transduction histidine kinase
MVAHDLRNPLNSITALVSLIQLPSSTEKEKMEYSSLILTACKNAEDTLQDLIDAAKQKETSVLEKEIVPVSEFLRNIKEQWDFRMTEKRKLLLSSPDKEILAPINKQKMQRVLDNLISNAVKFTQEDGVINITLKNEDEKLRISVSDNGIGIPENLQPYLFERFSKAGRPGLYGEKSYGLGLNICEQIVKQHNGTIAFNSKEKEGTTFYIDLPLHNN